MTYLNVQRAEGSYLVGLHAALDLGLGQCHPLGFGRGFDPRPLVLLPFRRSPPPLAQPVGGRRRVDLFGLLQVMGKRCGTTGVALLSDDIWPLPRLL